MSARQPHLLLQIRSHTHDILNGIHRTSLVKVAVRQAQGAEALAVDLARHVSTAPPALLPTQLAAALSAVWRAVIPRFVQLRLQDVQP